MSKEDLRAKVCHVCGTTEDLAACPTCHWWYCKKHDLHECTPELQNPIRTHYTKPKPSSLWYLVPFFFGIIGGLIGYVGTKDEDKDMATNLLILGIIISFISFVTLWAWIASLLH